MKKLQMMEKKLKKVMKTAVRGKIANQIFHREKPHRMTSNWNLILKMGWTTRAVLLMN
jgi:hypothetical protein